MAPCRRGRACVPMVRRCRRRLLRGALLHRPDRGRSNLRSNPRDALLFVPRVLDRRRRGVGAAHARLQPQRPAAVLSELQRKHQILGWNMLHGFTRGASGRFRHRPGLDVTRGPRLLPNDLAVNPARSAAATASSHERQVGMPTTAVQGCGLVLTMRPKRSTVAKPRLASRSRLSVDSCSLDTVEGCAVSISTSSTLSS